MRKRIGELWIGLGAFHLVLIGVLGAGELGDIVRAGLVNGVGDSIFDLQGAYPGRAAVFWLFYLGVPLVLTGILIRSVEPRVGTLPESFGWATVLAAAVGWVLVPASGFPLLLIIGGYTVVVARRERSERTLDGTPRGERERV
jgi:hypothetical protein